MAPPAESDEKPENWADKPESEVYKEAAKFYETIAQAYKNREEADQAIAEYWAIYNCEPDENQQYVGNSKGYLPFVNDAINARTKRAVKQLFPTKYKHVEAVGSDGVNPQPQLALLEHYIRTTKLKSICRSMLAAGDVTGQWNVYIDWQNTTRNVTGVVKRNKILETEGGEKLEVDSDEVETVTEDEEITEAGPDIVDFATEDLVVIPPTCNDINKAEVTSLKLRMSKELVERLVKDGVFILPNDEMDEVADWVKAKKGEEKVVPEKKRSYEAGIKVEGTYKYALIYWAQAFLEYEPAKDGKKGKTCLFDIYYAGENNIVGIVKAPQWGQKRSIISAPVDRISGSFNGISKIDKIKFLQWNANDFWNMGQDSAMYSLLPVVMTDPEKNPNYALMVYGLAAVWPVDPNSTKFTSFPSLWKDAVQMCQAIEGQINKALDVTDMMLGRTPAGRKNNQMVGAQQQEQSIPIIDHATRFEEEILNPLIERMFEYDAQFRDKDLTIVTQGEIGVKAEMQAIPVQQWGERYFFQWTGTSFTMGMQQMQQQIATMNVLRGIPPQQLNGRRLDITPILEVLVENVFGAEMGGKILIDDRNKFTIPPEIEDEMMVNGIMAEVHESDDDAQHMQVHQQAGQQSGDPAGLIRTHIQAHMQQMMKKRQMAAPPPPGQPGVPGGAGPGVAGSPRPGAQPAPQRPMQNPPGAVQQDAMMGAPGRG